MTQGRATMISATFGPSWAFIGISTPYRVFYFRVFDRGLHFQWGHDLSFSERIGMSGYVRVGPLVIRTLTANRSYTTRERNDG